MTDGHAAYHGDAACLESKVRACLSLGVPVDRLSGSVFVPNGGSL
jgi:hypothetical protein